MCSFSGHGGGWQKAPGADFSHGSCLGKLVTCPFQYLTLAACSGSPVTMQRHQALPQSLCMKDKKKKGGRDADSGREDRRKLEVQCGMQGETNKKKQKVTGY